MSHYDFDLDPVQRAIQKNMSQALFLPIFEDLPEFELDWLVQGFLPGGYLTMLAGPPKSGKTCLATALALAVATGTPFAGRPTQQSAVLWIAAEETPQERYQILKTSELADTACPLYTCYNRLNIDEELDLFALDREISRHEAKLVIVDPLLGAISGRSLQGSWNARKTLQLLKQLCGQRQVTALVLHHEKRIQGQPARVGDSDQVSATASMNIVLRRGMGVPPMSVTGVPPVQRATPPRLVTLDCQGRGEWSNQVLKLASNAPLDYQELTDQRRQPMPEGDFTAAESKVLNLLRDCPMPSEAILDRTEISIGTIRNVVARLRKRGLLKVAEIRDGVKHYGLVQVK